MPALMRSRRISPPSSTQNFSAVSCSIVTECLSLEFSSSSHSPSSPSPASCPIHRASAIYFPLLNPPSCFPRFLNRRSQRRQQCCFICQRPGRNDSAACIYHARRPAIELKINSKGRNFPVHAALGFFLMWIDSKPPLFIY